MTKFCIFCKTEIPVTACRYETRRYCSRACSFKDPRRGAKISKALTGKKLGPMDSVQRESIGFANRGRVHTDLARQHFSEGQAKRTDDRSHSKETIELIRAKNTGKKRTPEQRAAISEANRRYQASLTVDQRRARAKNLTRAGQNTISSKQEEALAVYLTSRGIPFKRQVEIGFYYADFLVANTVIELDGCYWHCCSKCGFDISRGPTLTAKKMRHFDERDSSFEDEGYRVIHIWEHDINGLGIRRSLNAALASKKKVA